MEEERGISEMYLGPILPSLSNDLIRSNGNQVACNGAQAILDEAPPLQTISLDLDEGKITYTGQNPGYDGPTSCNINGSENVMPKSIDDTIISDHCSDVDKFHNSGTDDVTKADNLSLPDTRPGADKNGCSDNLDEVTKVKCLVTPVEDVNKTVVTKSYLDMCIKNIIPNTLPIQTTNSDNNWNTNQVNTSQNLVTPQAPSPENNKKNTRVKNLSKVSIEYLNDRLSYGCSSKSWESIADYKGWNYEKIRIHSQKCTSHKLNPFEELMMHKDFAEYKVYQLLEDLKRIPREDLFSDFDLHW